MRLAHISDLHVLSLEGVSPTRLANKRLTGYANLKFKRNHIHHPRLVRALLQRLREVNPDHLVISGDLTNLALEPEFTAVREMLEEELGFPPDRVSIVPGNHDVYTRGSARERRFLHYFSEYCTSDRPIQRDEWGAFPFVRIRGPIAIFGVRSAVPRLPMIASGEIGEAQISAIRETLTLPEYRRLLPVFVLHHPPINPADRRKTATNGLTDATWFCAALSGLSEGLVLHGHLHQRIRRKLSTHQGSVDVIGATSASLDEPSNPDRMSGFNLYDISNDGYLTNAEAWVYSESGFSRKDIARP